MSRILTIEVEGDPQDAIVPKHVVLSVVWEFEAVTSGDLAGRMGGDPELAKRRAQMALLRLLRQGLVARRGDRVAGFVYELTEHGRGRLDYLDRHGCRIGRVGLCPVCRDLEPFTGRRGGRRSSDHNRLEVDRGSRCPR